jgi:hypothetical protein
MSQDIEGTPNYTWEKPGLAIVTLVLLEFRDFPMMRRVPEEDQGPPSG